MRSARKIKSAVRRAGKGEGRIQFLRDDWLEKSLTLPKGSQGSSFDELREIEIGRRAWTRSFSRWVNVE